MSNDISINIIITAEAQAFFAKALRQSLKFLAAKVAFEPRAADHGPRPELFNNFYFVYVLI